MVLKVQDNIQENGQIAREMCELGLWQEVLAFAQQWHLDQPTDYKALYYMGIGFSGLNQFRKAESAYRRALTIDPSAVKVWNNLAGILFDHMNCELEGIRCMEQSLQIDSNHKLGWSNLALMAGQIGQYDKAMSCAEKAIELDSEFVEAHLHKGRAALALGKTGIVEEVCHKLASIKPEKFFRPR